MVERLVRSSSYNRGNKKAINGSPKKCHSSTFRGTLKDIRNSTPSTERVDISSLDAGMKETHEQGQLLLCSGASMSWPSSLKSLSQVLSTVQSTGVATTLSMKQGSRHIQALLLALKITGFEKIGIGNDTPRARSVVSTNGYSARTKHLNCSNSFAQSWSRKDGSAFTIYLRMCCPPASSL